MTDERQPRVVRFFRGVYRFVRSWYAPAALSLVLLIAFVVWVTPRKAESVSTIDGEHEWSASDAPTTGRFVWKPAAALAAVEDVIRKQPEFKGGSLIRPQLADGGGTLYFTLRRADGNADIYRTQLQNGRWQKPAPVAAWNSPFADVGPALTADGQEAYLYSNRPGGSGGFDLYVSRRTQTGWSKPANLGPGINTAAHEYDPALSPDGLQLYFASNRTPLMSSPSFPSSRLGTRQSRRRQWKGTLRAEPGREQFDLHVARRNAVQQLWAEPVDVFAVNRDDSNEGAPAVSPDGLWLYFASDRSGGRGGFDLYRARLKGGRVDPPENLGPTINTAANEMEPAVSPEGFTLLFSSDRDRGDERYALYQSRAMEVTHRTAWDDANWRAFTAVLGDVWLWALLMTLLLAAAILLWRYYRGREAEKKTVTARFFLASLLVHALLLFVAGVVTIGQAIMETREEIVQITSAPEAVNEQQAAAKQDGLEAFEKLADLKALERNPAPPRERRVAELPNVPDAAQRRAPTIPLREAKQLPPDHVILVPRPRDFAPRQMQRLKRRPPEVPRQVALLKPVPLPLPKDAEPQEQPVPKQPEAVAHKPLPQNSAPRDVTTKLFIRPAEAKPFGNLPQPSTAKSVRPQPQVALNLPSRRAAAVGPAAPDEKPEDLPRLAKNDPPAEKPVDAGTKPDRESAPSAAAPVRTPRQLAGPRDPLKQRPVVGSLAKKPVVAPPSYHPRANPLQRRVALAKPVAEAKETVNVRQMFTLRGDDVRKKLLPLLGATDESERAVSRGLLWFAKHQFEDGHWSLNRFNQTCKGHAKCGGHGHVDSDTAATGFALLPFLARGQTHKKGEYQDVVRRGLDWLVEHQKKDGELFTGGTGNARMYSHAIATIALCEAYGMTRDGKLKNPCRKALTFIVTAQHKSSGGWRYRPNESGDTSVVGWQVMALKSGEMAGLEIPGSTLRLAGKWLDNVEARGKQAGRYGYTNRGPSPAMTAEGLLCRQFLGWERNDRRMRSGSDYLLEHLPKPGRETSYYWYYATQVMYHMQGGYWAKWGDSTRDMLVKSQVTAGHMAGTWNPSDQWENQAGRVYSTSVKLLMLEVYYRHLPLYRQLREE